MEENYLKRELYQRLHQDDELVEFLQSGSLDGLWYWDLDNPEQEWMSPRFWETFGYDPATRAHLASEWQDMIHPDDLTLALENFHQHCADPGYPYDQIVRYRHRDGSTVWVRCRGMVIRDDAGRPIRMLGAHTNVTALKESEERNRLLAEELQARAEELERTNTELESFASSVSHDHRAPLRAISGYATLLEEQHGRVLGAEGLKLLAVIQRNAGEMGTLISALLLLSRLGQQAIRPRTIDMTRLAAEAFEHATMARAIALTLGVLPEIEADPRLIAQVWSNLIENAVKYTGEEASPRIVISGTTTDTEAIYTVTDNGVGFDMDYADRLFLPFQRLHARSRFEGHGLGLALVQRIISRHGGRVWAEGEVGVGATLSFALPLSPA